MAEIFSEIVPMAIVGGVVVMAIVFFPWVVGLAICILAAGVIGRLCCK